MATTFTLGEHAVNGFFAISGFLVTMSFDNRGWRDYVVARTLRIAPALIAATLVVALVLGPALTRLPLAAYLSDDGTWRFITGTLTTFKSSAPLPGLFEANAFRFPMGTVWTLKYETFCYIGVFVAGFVGLFNRRWPALIVAAGLGLAVAGLDLVQPDAAKGVQTALRLTFIFAAGAALYVWRDTIRLSGLALAALVIATALLHATFTYNLLLFSAEAYGMIWLALVPYLTHPRLAISERSFVRHLSLRLAGAAISRRAVSDGSRCDAAAARHRADAYGGGSLVVSGREAGVGAQGANHRPAQDFRRRSRGAVT